VRKPGWGVVYRLFFWTSIPALVSLVEFIIYLMKSPEDIETAYPDTLGVGTLIGILVGVVVVFVAALAFVVLLIGKSQGWETG
tara:strand:+ start:1199 stop:1447 length:249 start_codon:yes stop_codon:yes gene_type:complete